MDQDTTFVHIIPIVNRVNGAEIPEVGAGGGKGDLDQTDELETSDAEVVEKLMQLCSAKIESKEELNQVLALLRKTVSEGKGRISLGDIMGQSQLQDDDLPLQEVVSALTSAVSDAKTTSSAQANVIKFPYSRHSSYTELCTLVEALQPRDIYPCTVDEKTWLPAISMRSLFGQYCSASVFRHDAEMMEMYELRVSREQRGKRGREETPEETQRSVIDEETQMEGASQSPEAAFQTGKNRSVPSEKISASEPLTMPLAASAIPPTSSSAMPHLRQSHDSPSPKKPPVLPSSSMPKPPNNPPPVLPPSTAPKASSSHLRSVLKRFEPRMSARAIAYYAAIGMGLTWEDLGGLVSTRRHGEEEVEL